MAKRCSQGKSCGASCVAMSKSCEIPLTRFNKSFDLISDRILSRGAVLDTPGAAVKWLEANKERLASSGGGNWGDPKGDVLILAIEPGDNPAELYYNSDRKLHKRLEMSDADRNLSNNDWQDWYDRHPLVFANDIRQRYMVGQAAKAYPIEGGEGVLNQRRGRALGDVDSKGKDKPEAFSVDTFKASSRPFTRKLGLVADGVGKSVEGLNVSPFGLPSDKYWPFEKLPLKEGSVFKSRESWLKFASKGAINILKEQLDSSPRKLVYVGANTRVHKNIFKELSKEFGQPSTTKTFSWKSSAGKEMKADVNFFVINRNGNKTVVVQTNHPSWTGWPNGVLGEMNGMIKGLLGT